MNRKTGSKLSTLSRKARLLFWLVILAIPVATLELGLRIYVVSQLGSSILFYGTRLNREKVGDTRLDDMNLRDGYFKYHPRQERFTRDRQTGELIRATINSSGFRGPDFQRQKGSHIIRVVTLGASSTFGFSNRDEETYPYYLEQLMNLERPDGDRFEVINLGIPHLWSAQILTLFRAEALPLDPDVVTFYEGVNDSWNSPVLWEREKAAEGAVRVKLRKVFPLRQAFRWLRDHSITVVLADGFMKARRDVTFTEEDLAEHVRGKSENFLRNISVIFDECENRGIIFIVASQQAKSFLVDRDDIKGVTYEEESELVSLRFAENKYINRLELYFLTHNVLMTDLEEWSKTNDVPYVDIISAMDQHRDCLVSWVHLNPEGNRIVAEAFASAVRSELGVPKPF